MNDEQNNIPQEETGAAVAPPAPPTQEEQRRQMGQVRLLIFAAYADAERQKLATRRGLLKNGKPTEKLIAWASRKDVVAAGHGIAFDENEQVKPEELRFFVPLPGDSMNYAADEKTKLPRLALDKYGFISFPKQHGRRRKHLSGRENVIKGLALQAFPMFFAEHGGKLLLDAKAAAVKAGVDFDETTFGIPDADMPKIYEKANVAATAMYERNAKLTRRQRRRQQQLSRRINAHNLPSDSVPAHKYFIFGAPGGPGGPCMAGVICRAKMLAAAIKAKEAAGGNTDVA